MTVFRTVSIWSSQVFRAKLFFFLCWHWHNRQRNVPAPKEDVETSDDDFEETDSDNMNGPSNAVCLLFIPFIFQKSSYYLTFQARTTRHSTKPWEGLFVKAYPYRSMFIVGPDQNTKSEFLVDLKGFFFFLCVFLMRKTHNFLRWSYLLSYFTNFSPKLSINLNTTLSADTYQEVGLFCLF